MGKKGQSRKKAQGLLKIVIQGAKKELTKKLNVL